MSSALVTDAPTLALAQVFGTNEKCQTSSSHVHPPSVHRSGSKLVAGATLSKEATLSGRLFERIDDGTA